MGMSRTGCGGFWGFGGFWSKREVIGKNSGFSGGNGGGLVLLVDRGFSEKWGFSW